MNKTEMIRLLKAIESKTCHAPKGVHHFSNEDRVRTIDEELQSSNYHWVKGHKYYRLYAQDSLENLKKYPTITLVSSHADNLQSCSSYERVSNDLVRGCFDNASTNAVCVYLMKHMPLPPNVLFVFTADEERLSKGASRVSEKLKCILGEDKVNVIVLDVTYGFQNGVDFTIENDFIHQNSNGEQFIKTVCDVANQSGYSWNFLYSDEGYESNDGYMRSAEIRKYMGEGCKEYNEVEGQDETVKYASQGFNTFSQCLPCSADEDQMHSEEGFMISLKTLNNYMDFLYQVLKEGAQEMGAL